MISRHMECNSNRPVYGGSPNYGELFGVIVEACLIKNALCSFDVMQVIWLQR